MKDQEEFALTPPPQPAPSHSPEAQTAPVRQKKVTPMMLVQKSIENNAPIDTIERMVALAERQIARDAELDFNEALTACQSEIAPVFTNKENTSTHSRYATYDQLDRAIRPIYTKHGFAPSFDTEPTEKVDTVLVTCLLSHVDGHKRKYRIDMPADGKGAKGNDVMSKTHAAGSAVSYGMRYLLKMMFNVPIAGDDDDGNAASNGQVMEWCEWLENCRNLDELQTQFSKIWPLAVTAGRGPMQAVAKAKDKRKRELKGETK